MEVRNPETIERDRVQAQRGPAYPFFHIFFGAGLFLIGAATSIDAIANLGLMVFLAVHFDWRLRQLRGPR